MEIFENIICISLSILNDYLNFYTGINFKLFSSCKTTSSSINLAILGTAWEFDSHPQKGGSLKFFLVNKLAPSIHTVMLLGTTLVMHS